MAKGREMGITWRSACSYTGKNLGELGNKFPKILELNINIIYIFKLQYLIDKVGNTIINTSESRSLHTPYKILKKCPKSFSDFL